MNKILSLKKIDIDEILPFYNILAECGQFMCERFGLDHWYPFMEVQMNYVEAEGHKKLAQAKGAFFAHAGLGK